MFYAITGAVLGTYEAVAVTTKRVPTVSAWSARRRHTRVLAVAWALGLAVHLARHKP